MNLLKTVTKLFSDYLGLILLWVIVFFVTIFLVSILIQNWQLKKQASLQSEYLISELRTVIIMS